MLRELLTAREVGLRAAARVVPDGALPESTLRHWYQGEAAPHATAAFWSLVDQLDGPTGPYGSTIHPREEWEAVLRAAQAESSKGRSESPTAPRKRNRTGERAAMDAFVKDRSPHAPSYLWWHAELPVGKTTLLTDYAAQPYDNADVLSCILSEKLGTNTRTGFLKTIGEQFEVDTPRRKRSDEARFAHLLAGAAAKSRKNRRQLVLVIDGLDEDLAWPAAGAPPTEAGSIAALLPADPPANVRIIVSSRLSGPLPADVPDLHPLRLRDCLRPLTAGDRAKEVEQASLADLERLRATDPGRAVTDLLAMTDDGAGLRVSDLADLTGASVEAVTGLLHNRQQRCIISNDAPTGTYLLSHQGMSQAIRRGWDRPNDDRRSRELHTWADRWHAAGWPEGAPPHLLTEWPQPPDDLGRREHVLLDPQRQLRVADTLGPQLALDQLRALSDGFTRATVPGPPGPPGPPGIDTAVRLAASLDLMQRRVGEVPPRAPVLLARLGDVPRARTVARSEPHLVRRAARLAQVAVEAARVRHPHATAIALEAADCTVRAGRYTPRAGGVFQDACADVAEAADALASSGRKTEAKALYRAVLLSGASDLNTLVRGSELFTEGGDRRFVEALEEHAEDLSLIAPRAQAIAVDVWATIARLSSSRSLPNLDRIEALCKNLALVDGLAVVDVLALGAHALATTTGRRTWAEAVLRAARDRLFTALVRLDPTPADQAHRGREFSATVERMARAETAVGLGRTPHLDAGLLVTALAQGVRTGVLDDDLFERAETFLAAVNAQIAAEDAARLAAQQEQRRARRREQDARREALATQRRATEAARGRTRTTRRSPLPKQPEPAATSATDVPAVPAPRPVAEDIEPLPRPVTRLQYAEQLLHSGNLELGREQLAAALHDSLPTAPVVLHGGWTEDLIRALGTAGELAQAEGLVRPCARHYAALSLGCSFGGRAAEAAAYAREAARLMPHTPHFAVRAAVAQALAHAGDADAAVSLARAEDPADTTTPSSVRARRTRRALLLVAAGIARHAPERAAELVAPAVRLAQRRLDAGSPVNQLPSLAELLLTLPDPSQPGPELGRAITLAAEFTDRPRQSWDTDSAVVLSLLRRRLGCTPPQARTPDEPDAWLHSLRPERTPHSELALFSALDGDTAAAHRIADAAATPTARATALAAAARVLAGTPATLPIEEPENGTLELCLALTHALTHALGSTDTDRAAARGLLHASLADGSWTQAMPLLPQLAPSSLRFLSALVTAHLDVESARWTPGAVEPRSAALRARTGPDNTKAAGR
ncbi:hypothetical protein OHV13_16340 [Kitasatospora purpeofusca]|uniref:hypothetical protein n=1 Tax=Kitasatospora purpeofusca TaxID=67352 RepID=UPI0032516B48